MQIPFTIEQFLNIFKNYNLAVWPMQIIIYLAAFGTILLAVKKNGFSDLVVSLILAFFWLWMGAVYHLIYLTTINKAAYFFGLFYIVQAVLFLYFGVIERSLGFKYQFDLSGLLGTIFIIYALLIYPVLGYALGHVYPQTPTFGVPCPTTIFTFGILLWTDKKVPKILLVIPFLWSIIGFSAAINLSMKEDYGLAIAGVIGAITLILRDKKVLKKAEG